MGEILFNQRVWLGARPVLVQQLLAVLGLAIGVALLFASQVASTSLNSSVSELTNGLVGSTQFQLESGDPEGFSERIVPRVQRLPGVKVALPLLERPATVIGPHGEASVDLLGANPSFVRAGALPRHLSTKFLARQEAVALPAGLAAQVGASSFETITIHIGATLKRVSVGAVLGHAAIGALANSQIALAPINYAQTLAGTPGRLTRIFIQARHGQDARVKLSLQRLAVQEHLTLEPANFDARLFAVASAPSEQGESLFSAISAFVGFLFAFTAMLLTAPERRKFIQGMRVRGTTRVATIQFLCWEAFVLGMLAVALGLVLGDLFSEHIFHSEPGYLSFAFPVGSQREVTATTIALAVGVGMIAAFVGIFAPLRAMLSRPVRPSAINDQAPAGWTPFWVGIGAFSLVVTTLILVLRPQAAVVGNLTLLVGLMCLLPFLYGRVIDVFDVLQRPFGAPSTRLALMALREPVTRSRSLAVAATGAIAVFGSVAISGARANLEHGLDRTATEVNDVTNLWVSPAGVNNTLGTTPFLSALATTLRQVSAVKAVAVYRGGFLDIGDRRTWIIAPPRNSPQLIPPGQLTEGNIAQASARLRGHGWAVISEAIAQEMHLHIGDSFTLPSPHPIHFRVAALSTNGGWPPGAIIINAADYAEAWGTSAASALMVTLRRGISPALGRHVVLKALGPSSGLAVQTASQRADAWQTISHQGLGRLSQIAKLVIFAAILAMAGVMTSMIWQRRQTIAYVKRLGIKGRTVWLALFFESAVLLGAGCSIGAAFGLFGQLVISHALATVTGFPIEFSTGAVTAIVKFSIVSATALAIVAIPGGFAARARPTLVSPK